MITTLSRALAIHISSRRVLFSFLAIGLTSFQLLAVKPARADVEAPVVVPIQTTVVPGQPFHQLFNEEQDFIHTKNILFEGNASTTAGAVGTLDIQFDWYDPNAGGFLLSPHFLLQVPGGAPVPFSFPFSIPFCPPEISLHMEALGDVTAVPILVDGKFTYQCVPEPSTIVLFGLALASLVGYSIRKRRA